MTKLRSLILNRENQLTPEEIDDLLPEQDRVKVVRVRPCARGCVMESYPRAFLLERLITNGAHLIVWPTKEAGRHMCSTTLDGSFLVVSDEIAIHGAVFERAS